VDHHCRHGHAVGVPDAEQLRVSVDGNFARMGRGHGAGVSGGSPRRTPHEEAGARQLSLWGGAEAA
jgi:hypothetical protein